MVPKNYIQQLNRRRGGLSDFSLKISVALGTYQFFGVR